MLGARPFVRAGLLVFEIAATGVLVGQPAFAARDVTVDGTKVLTRASVIQRADLTDEPSIFSLSADRIQARLASEPYIKSVSVSLVLPGSVRIHVTEWVPFAVASAAGRDYLLNEAGSVLQATGGTAAPRPQLMVAFAVPRAPARGDRVINARLLVDLSRMESAFPAAYGLNIQRFELSADSQLVADTIGGPRILFGQMVTEEQINSLDLKLASLKALSKKVDLAHSHLEYVNVMNPAEPVTRVVPSPTPSASPSPKHN